MTERERVARLLYDAWPGKEHAHPSLVVPWPDMMERKREPWVTMADAVLADRREQNTLAVEHMEARIEAAEARADWWMAENNRNLTALIALREAADQSLRDRAAP